MIHVVDYGLGNVQAFLTMFKRLGFEATRAQTASDLIGASKIILPGVGAFFLIKGTIFNGLAIFIPSIFW